MKLFPAIEGEDVVREALKAAIEEAGSVTELSRRTGLTRGLISNVACGGAPVPNSICQKLGYEKVIVYRKVSA